MGAKITIPPTTDTTRADICKIITGSYTGDGNDNRTINIGINLAAKSNVCVMVKKRDNESGVFRIEYAQGDLGMYFVASTDIANLIQSFAATGFIIGSHTAVNHDTWTFRYIVFYTEE